jgi:hypothetical protein
MAWTAWPATWVWPTAPGWPGRVTVVTDPRTADPRTADAGDEPTGLLIRPDGVIVWAGPAPADLDPHPAAALEQALLQWAGAPAAARPVRAR